MICLAAAIVSASEPVGSSGVTDGDGATATVAAATAGEVRDGAAVG